MFLAKSAIPCGESQFFKPAALQEMAESPFIYITAPPGYLPSGCISSILGSAGHPLLWLRLGAEDRDPASLLLSLIYTGKYHDRRLGDDTLGEMQHHPGCVYGWTHLYENLGAEFASILPRSCAFVLENVHELGEDSAALKLARFHFLDQLHPSTIRIIISHTELPAGFHKDPALMIGVRELEIHPGEDLCLVRDENLQPAKADLDRILQLSQGRSEVLSAVLSASNQTGDRYIHRILHQAKTMDQLLTQIGRNCLNAADPQGLLALSLASLLGYFHTEIFKGVSGNTTLPEGVWLQPLSTDWVRIRELWQPVLQALLHHHIEVQKDVFCQAAMQLARMGAVEIAVPLCLQTRRYEQAGTIIRSCLESLMNFGQWETLNGWLKQLPTDIILGSPEILYAQGELQAFYGLHDRARTSFSQSGKLFSHHGEFINACRCLLAESALAYSAGDKQSALRSAQTAHILSSTAPPSQERAWANWQLGRLISMDGRPSLAKTQFQDACQLTNDPYTREIFQQALACTEEIEQAGLQEEYHRQEAQQAEQTRLKKYHYLLDLLKAPPVTLPDLLKQYGWFAVPLTVKLSMQNIEGAAQWRDPIEKLVHRFRTKVRVILPWGKTPGIPNSLSPLGVLAPVRYDPLTEDSTSNLNLHVPVVKEPESKPVKEDQKIQPGIMIYCLGPLRVMNNGQFITSWPSHKAQLVFKYLLLHRNTPVHKETIMETFWPEADAEAARRNLHQAIYNLRLTLKDIEDSQQIIQFEQDGYRINPSLPIWIDYTVFEQHYTTAHQKELADSADQAMAEYALAEELYMDHLFVDDLYEDWMRSQREYLWQIYLSAATRLAEYYSQNKNYSSAISIGQRILQKDPCEETAHQILMRCFHSQGQRQLAIRQYEICRQALREELDVEPSSTTQQFFTKILRQ